MTSIVSVVERGGFVYVYGDQNRMLFALPAGSSPGDGLKGYTSSSVSIRRSGFIYVYNGDGGFVQIIPA